ncbi:expressed unknown protein [Seminavis robusta]|uniref:Uncharacterized protein n=1 Tax=Seminavis robusta TaxID=568900 RepID=A0A9N8DWH6_9STRA|nr:expressed unknown protein [Seminavis robusta]|eukprot:Sro411_g137620.1 n/a (384) ;mRNA; f:23611-25096
MKLYAHTLFIAAASLFVSASSAADKGFCYDGYRAGPPKKCHGNKVGTDVTHAECVRLDNGKCWSKRNGINVPGSDAREGACFEVYVPGQPPRCDGTFYPGQKSKHECLCEHGGMCWISPGGSAERTTAGRRRTMLRQLQADPSCPSGDVDCICEDPTVGGECDLVLMDAPAINLTVHIRTQIRYQYSYITSAAVRLDDEVLEVAGWGEYVLNGVDMVESSTDLLFAGRNLTHVQRNKKEHIFDVALNDWEHLSLKTFKDWVSVKVSPSTPDHFETSVGLLGQYKTGEKLGRDGETVFSNDNEFGQAWQVRAGKEPMLFQSVRSPQYPEPCRLPDITKTGRRLGMGIPQESAEKACAGWRADKERCIEDVLKSGDLEMAEAGGY